MSLFDQFHAESKNFHKFAEIHDLPYPFHKPELPGTDKQELMMIAYQIYNLWKTEL